MATNPQGIPPLPPGYKLEQPIPPLPKGYKLVQPDYEALAKRYGATSSTRPDGTQINHTREIRVQDERGVIHVFPEGSTIEMIAKVMNVKPPSAVPIPKGSTLEAMQRQNVPIPPGSSVDYAALAKQAGAVSSTPEQASVIPPLPAGYKLEDTNGLHPTPENPDPNSDHPGMIKQMWNWANKGIISKDTFVGALTGMTPEQLDKTLKSFPEESPVHAAIREFARGTIQDTSDTASSFTSPLAAGTMAIGAAGKIPGAIGKVAKAVTGTAAAGFGAQGAGEVVSAGTENTPEAWRQRLQGGAMAAGGAAGVGETISPKAMRTPVSQVPRAVADAVPSPRGAMAARMAEKPVGEQFTRQEVLDAARSKGVNLDLADATEAGGPASAKRLLERSLGGAGRFSENQKSNLASLEKWANSEAEKYSGDSAPREVIGAQMQAALKSHLEARKGVATQAFQELDRSIGANKVDVTGTVQAEAQKIIDQNKSYYEEHPELKPKQAWGILEDLAKRPTKNVTSASPEFTDNSGNAITQSSRQVSANKSMSWTELHQLRSDLMDFYRNNPDVVKGRSEAWIQQMVGKIDGAMTSSGNGLSGADLAQFRNANKIWDSIKSTYDNPQHPYYQAVRTQYPSGLPANLVGKPELARHVRQTLSSLQDGGTMEGAFQRQFVENLINDKSGVLDLKNLNSKLSRMPVDVLQAMVGEEGARNLRMLGKVAQKVTSNSNPSGTGAVNVSTKDWGALATGGAALVTGHPAIAAGAAAIPLVENMGAKALTSPSLLKYLTQSKTK
ncbi:MAG: hypothetical protein JWO13_2747 [Acidobacteriales bacterium]|nr:hypothetical protein [Terriglobales bacterium]